MLKSTLLAASAAIAIVAAASPASAFTTFPGPNQPPTQKVPEPATILGTIAVGGALLAQKKMAAKKAEK
jgi:hypothetical protein